MYSNLLLKQLSLPLRQIFDCRMRIFLVFLGLIVQIHAAGNKISIPQGQNCLTSVSIAGRHVQNFVYDPYDRITQVTETVDDSKVFVHNTTYDMFGHVFKETYLGYAPSWGANTKGWGAWNKGEVYSAPLWIGLRGGNTVSRFGYSHWRVQNATQNFVHRYFPLGRQHYYTGYRSLRSDWYDHSGYYNPFSLY